MKKMGMKKFGKSGGGKSSMKSKLIDSPANVSVGKGMKKGM